MDSGGCRGRGDRFRASGVTSQPATPGLREAERLQEARRIRLTRWVVVGVFAVYVVVSLRFRGGPLLLSATGVLYACRRDPSRHSSRRPLAIGVVFGTVLAPVLAGVLAWWEAGATVAVVGFVPVATGFVYDLFNVVVRSGNAEGVSHSDSRWILYLWARDWLRAAFMLSLWVGVGTSLSGFDSSLSVAAPALACVLGHPLLATVCLIATMPFTGVSGSWLLAAVMVLLLTLARVPPRPPTRNVALPRAPWTLRLGLRRRTRAVDRAVKRSLWRDASLLAGRFASGDTRFIESMALREARARLELGESQAAADALRLPLVSSDSRLRASAYRLLGETLTISDRPEDALAALEEAARLWREDQTHQALTALASAAALVGMGDWEGAVERARSARVGLSGRGLVVERLRCVHLITEGRWRAGRVRDAVRASQGTIGPTVATRWTRRFVKAGGYNRGHEDRVAWKAGFSRSAPFLAEEVRGTFLEAQIALDPRSGKSAADATEAVDRLSDVAEGFRRLGSPLDAAEACLVLARSEAGKGFVAAALEHTLSALSDLDHVRHSLSTQAARARWSVRFNSALAQALQLAAESGNSLCTAELIELARVQAMPVLAAGDPGSFDLAPAPTVRVRGRAGIIRAHRLTGNGPVDLERAAGSAAGDGAWWLSSWATDTALFWALVPSDLEAKIDIGRIDLSESSELSAALADLEASLPIRAEGEDVADTDIRVASGPLRSSLVAETKLALRLGGLLLPDTLREELLRRHQLGTGRLRLAISPAPILGHVPWCLLAAAGGGDEACPMRLVELADWVLAPSATLLVHADTGVKGQAPYPLKLAVLDPTASDLYPSLPAARAVAGVVSPSVEVLGCRHWATKQATVLSVVDGLRRAGPSATVMFGCHAVRGRHDRPSESAVVLSDGDGDPEAHDGAEMLSAANLFGLGIPVNDFPAQVSLQACDTSDLASAVGGEWLSLAPSFLGVGARAVITTAFPLVDAVVDPQSDPLLQAIMAGEDLVDAVRTAQLQGLNRWRAASATGRRVQLADSPLLWSAYAVCAAGRSHSWSQGAAPTSDRISPRLWRSLGDAAKMAREVRDRTVTTAHFCAAYALDETELFTNSWIKAAGGAILMYILTKVLRGTATDRQAKGLRPSMELLESLAVAVGIAEGQGCALQPEHLIGVVRDQQTALGSKLMRLSGLDKMTVFAGSVAENLRNAEVSSYQKPRPESEEAIRAFVHSVLAAVAAQGSTDTDTDTGDRSPGGTQNRS